MKTSDSTALLSNRHVRSSKTHSHSRHQNKLFFNILEHLFLIQCYVQNLDCFCRFCRLARLRNKNLTFLLSNKEKPALTSLITCLEDFNFDLPNIIADCFCRFCRLARLRNKNLTFLLSNKEKPALTSLITC